MNNALHQLWLKNTEEIFGRNLGRQQVKELTSLIQQSRDKLSSTLTDEQKEALEKYDDCYAELHVVYFEQVFADGLRLGMQLTPAGILQEK